MLRDWVHSHDPNRVFLSSEAGAIHYGDLARLPAADGGRQVVEPDESLGSVRRLMAPSGAGQMVVVDPRLPSDERRRRLEAARQAEGRRAATILFTSGTEGRAKAVRLTWDNWLAAAAASASHLDHTPDDVWLAAMPLNHVGGLSILYRTAYVGAQVRWLPRFEAAAVADALGGGVTLASLVPTMLRRLLDHDARVYSGLRAVLVGGGPIPDGLLEEAHARGIPALPTYGMTETCAQVATLRPGSPPRRAAHPLPGVELRISPRGLIEIRGDQVSPGYADQDDRPAGEWFTTSDRGRLDPDGALRVLGRADDVIVTGGENVDPGRVEGVLCSHPGVSAATVAGVSDDEWGELVVAAYEGTVSPRELEDFARTRLASHELPRRMRRLDRLPLDRLGKPDRSAVRGLFLGARE